MEHDADIFDRVLGYVTDFSAAVDVGAHKGAWTEKMVSFFGTTYCFEPNILLCDRLSAWADREYNNVIVHNCAILDIDSYGSLYFPEGSPEKTRSYYARGDKTGRTMIRRLESYRIKGCGLLKIDIEGGELLALRGARRMLRHQRPVVVVEYKPQNAMRFGWTLGNLNSYMWELGYRTAFSKSPNLVFAR